MRTIVTPEELYAYFLQHHEVAVILSFSPAQPIYLVPKEEMTSGFNSGHCYGNLPGVKPNFLVQLDFYLSEEVQQQPQQFFRRDPTQIEMVLTDEILLAQTINLPLTTHITIEDRGPEFRPRLRFSRGVVKKVEYPIKEVCFDVCQSEFVGGIAVLRRADYTFANGTVLHNVLRLKRFELEKFPHFPFAHFWRPSTREIINTTCFERTQGKLGEIVAIWGVDGDGIYRFPFDSAKTAPLSPKWQFAPTEDLWGNVNNAAESCMYVVRTCGLRETKTLEDVPDYMFEGETIFRLFKEKLISSLGDIVREYDRWSSAYERFLVRECARVQTVADAYAAALPRA